MKDDNFVLKVATSIGLSLFLFFEVYFVYWRLSVCSGAAEHFSCLIWPDNLFMIAIYVSPGSMIFGFFGFLGGLVLGYVVKKLRTFAKK